MEQIRAGQIRASYLFDVAEAIDLQQLPAVLKAGTGRVQFVPKPASPAYVQFQPPPVTVSGDLLDLQGPGDFRISFKFYDYGVISVTLFRRLECSWAALLALGETLVGNPELDAWGERLCRQVLERCAPACSKIRQDVLDEDYLIFAVHEFERPVSAAELLEARGPEIARLLRGESKPLHAEEVREVLASRLSYLSDDLVIPTWSTAFVYDTPQGAEMTFELMEFANSQLLEFRYYDDLLDRELDRVYAEIQQRRVTSPWQGRRFTGTARELQSLIIDVNSLTDRTENALKVVGDVYAARLSKLLESRLSLDRWKASVNEKLATLNQIYRFLTDQVNVSLSMTLELIIVAVLLVELWLILVGLIKP